MFNKFKNSVLLIKNKEDFESLINNLSFDQEWKDDYVGKYAIISTKEIGLRYDRLTLITKKRFGEFKHKHYEINHKKINKYFKERKWYYFFKNLPIDILLFVFYKIVVYNEELKTHNSFFDKDEPESENNQKIYIDNVTKFGLKLNILGKLIFTPFLFVIILFFSIFETLIECLEFTIREHGSLTSKVFYQKKTKLSLTKKIKYKRAIFKK